MALSLRAATFGDAPAIAAVYAPYVQHTVISFEEIAPTAEQMHDRMAASIASHPWLVACRDGEVVGYAYSSRHRERAAYRWSVDVSVYLSARWHRGGIGRALYTTLLAALRELGFARAYAGITLPNQASVGLHEAMGFTLVGVYQGVGYKNGAWRDVGWWDCRLDGAMPQPQEPRSFAELKNSRAWERCLDAGMRLLAR
ncbi:MAG TPA: arsinothricin resistance N-acetyltransferase ArsN1 family B [Candidatus Limnocylindrales bacterium]|nr:arsinothricin resistance N-acetyltransferase ArsN1 family B [Candidatus Limnocylindrales bacterium]